MPEAVEGQSATVLMLLAYLRATSRNQRAARSTEQELLKLYSAATREVGKIIRESSGMLSVATDPLLGTRPDFFALNPSQTRAVDDVMRRIDAVLQRTNNTARATLAVGLMSYASTNAEDIVKAINKSFPKAAQAHIQFRNTLSMISIAQIAEAPLAGETFAQRLSGYAFSSSRQMRAAMLDSLTQGRAISTLQRRLQAIMRENLDKPIPLLIETEYERVQNDIARAIFRQPENRQYISGFTYMTSLNSSVCRICARDHGKFFPVNTRMRLPRHPRCRCRLVPKLKKWADLNRAGLNIPPEFKSFFDGKSTKGFATFDEFLASQTEEYQRDYLGPARYELFKKGVSTQDMANQDKAFTLDELKSAPKKRRAREMIKVGKKHGTFYRRKGEKITRIAAEFKRRLTGDNGQDTNRCC